MDGGGVGLGREVLSANVSLLGCSLHFFTFLLASLRFASLISSLFPIGEVARKKLRETCNTKQHTSQIIIRWGGKWNDKIK